MEPMPRSSRRLTRLATALGAAALAVLPAPGADAGDAIRLVVRGDDMGFAHASNPALIRCYTDGIMRSVEILAVGPWFPEAARLLRENPGLDVGLHLALTSEWDNVKWRPLTSAPSLTDDDGFFHPMIRVHPHYGREGALIEHAWKIDEIERELRAQVALARREVPRLSHVTTHMGFSDLSPEVEALVERLATENDLLFDVDALGVKRLEWNGPHSTSAEKVATFARMLESLSPGTWLFVEHPALDTDETRAIHHVGYEDVAVDRQGVLDAWTSPRVQEVVARRGIVLTSYGDLARSP